MRTTKQYGVEIKQRALEMRKLGVSLRGIATVLSVPVGTAGSWVSGVKLTKAQKGALLSRPQAGGSLKKDRGVESPLFKMVKHNLTRDNKAQIAEAAVMLRMTLMGMEIYGSVFDGAKADCLVRVPSGRSAVIQVKWARSGNHGLPLINLTCSDGHTKRRRGTE